MLSSSKFELKNRLSFLYKFVRSPGSVGSITPSSVFLAKRIMLKLPWDSIDSIVELGAGTGVFTRHIYKRKKPSCKVIIFEKDVQLHNMLKKSHPSSCFGHDAEKLSGVLKQLKLDKVDCIVSGLPFAMFPVKKRSSILQSVVNSLQPGGTFIAFQYSLQMKTMLKRHFDKVDISLVALNIPPAFVYVCKKA